MYKKAGIVVGALIAVVVIVIVLATSGGTSKPEKQVSVDPAVTNQTQEQTQTSTPAQQQSYFVTVNTDTLPTPKRNTAVGFVQDKAVVLVGNQLYYTITLLVGKDNLQLTYIVSEGGYNLLNLNDKCEVDWSTYTTQSGSVYYLVNGVSQVE